MLLSDELIEIGRTANPKSNMSMGDVATKMHEVIKKQSAAGRVDKRTFNIIKMVCDQLNKEGFNYYGTDIFFTEGGKK